MDASLAERIVEVAHLVGHRQGGRVTIAPVANEVEAEPETVKQALGALFLAPIGTLYGKYEPHHRKCDAVLGQVELSEDELYLKFHAGRYPRQCPECHDLVESVSDILVRVQFWLSEMRG
jgi:hypothetical protein